MFRYLGLTLILLISTVDLLWAQAMVTEVFPLGYRSAAEVVPVLRPVVAPHGSVSGISGQLVVTASPSQMNEIRRLLAVIDKAPERLLLTVKRDRSVNTRHDSVSVHGQTDNLSINDGSVIVGNGMTEQRNDTNNSLSATLESNARSNDQGIVQQIQVVEGREAYISIGEEVPIRHRGVAMTPGGVYHYNSTQYYPAVTGVYAIARIKGDDVFLDISTTSRQRTTMGRTTGGAWVGRHTQQPISSADLSTSVGGRVGEWIPIGSVDQTGTTSQRGILAASKAKTESLYGIYIKVDRIKD